MTKAYKEPKSTTSTQSAPREKRIRQPKPEKSLDSIGNKNFRRNIFLWNIQCIILCRKKINTSFYRGKVSSHTETSA